MRAAVLAGLLWLSAGVAQAECRLALALGVDVSGSVDAVEYRVQLDGIAAALESPEVLAAMLETPDTPVLLAIYEWSGPRAQRLLVDWVAVGNETVLYAVAEQLRGVQRLQTDPSTALGQAKIYGAQLLARQPACWRHVLDISGDGKSNSGPRPQDVPMPDITVNGLVIGTPAQGDRDTPGVGELVAYFRAHVISGHEAFVETALGFKDIEAAMRRKLVREVRSFAIGAR